MELGQGFLGLSIRPRVWGALPQLDEAAMLDFGSLFGGGPGGSGHQGRCAQSASKRVGAECRVRSRVAPGRWLVAAGGAFESSFHGAVAGWLVVFLYKKYVIQAPSLGHRAGWLGVSGGWGFDF